MTRIYLSPPHMGRDELELLEQAFASNWIAPLGPQVDAFERELAKAVGAPYAAALSSGTAALHLALRILGVGPGDEVICPTLTFVASANPICYLGAEPVFVDCRPETWTLDPALVEGELEQGHRSGRPAKAVISVDLYGQTADYEALEAICERYGVPLIEDAAEALGSTYRDRSAGTFGRCGFFSFNGNKILTTSGGGMLVSHDAELVERARFLSTQARDPAPHYQHSEIGYNYRLSNLLAAVGRGQLRGLAERVAARRANFAFYRQELGKIDGLELMPEAPYGRSNRWLTCITLDPAKLRATPEDLRQALERQEIEARPIWKPLHLQPLFASCRRRGGEVAEEIFRRGLCLPSGSSLEEADLARVTSALRRALR